jgi:hypothetical protein
VTALDGLDRFTAAIAGITIPRQQRWHGRRSPIKDLMKLPSVKRWCEMRPIGCSRRAMRPTPALKPKLYEDIRQEGKYGTSAMWVGESRRQGPVLQDPAHERDLRRRGL